MAHFKCVACRTRQYRAAGPADVVGELCPGCGSLLEPVGELAEVFGFRHVTSGENVADGERWLDDGGSLSPEAVENSR